MHHPSDSVELAEPGQGGPDTVIAEVLPGVGVVLGKVPAELKLDLIDFGSCRPLIERGSRQFSPRWETQRPWVATSRARSAACRGSTD
ncbi:hypothetical protein ACFQX7_33155 [Luedemannella flava]